MAVVRRLADQFTTVYGFSDLKKYSRLDPTFSTLPQNVTEILINNFQNLDLLQLTTLQENAELNIPTGPSLSDEQLLRHSNENLQTILEVDEQEELFNTHPPSAPNLTTTPATSLILAPQDSINEAEQTINTSISKPISPISTTSTDNKTQNKQIIKPTLRTSPIMTRNRTSKLNIETNSDSDNSDQELDRKQVSFQ